jgi:hypothetical protein
MKKIKSVNLDFDRHKAISDKCLQLSLDYSERVSITSVMHILIDEHLDQAIAKRIKQLNFEAN